MSGSSSGRNGNVLKLSKTLQTYDRRYKVPAINGTAPKVCGKCNDWFAALPRERVCYGCSPARERVKRSSKVLTPGRANERTKHQVKGRAMCHSLAREAVAGIDYPELRKLRGVTILAEPVRAERRCPLAAVTDRVLRGEHRRAVAEGRQGCTCTAAKAAAA
jgi:hypothetical protein